MVNKLNKYFFSFLLVLGALCSNAQKYNTVGGIRIGDDFGFSFAQRVANKTTVELNLQPGTFTGKELYTVLAKQHYPLLSKRLNFFAGAGIYSRNLPLNQMDIEKKQLSSGLALVLGAEVTFGKLSISTDYLPLVTLFKNDTNQRFQTTSGVSLRYVFVGRESSTKKFFKGLFNNGSLKKSGCFFTII